MPDRRAACHYGPLAVRASLSSMHTSDLTLLAARFRRYQFYFGKAASPVDTLPKKRHRAFILPTFRSLADESGRHLVAITSPNM